MYMIDSLAKSNPKNPKIPSISVFSQGSTDAIDTFSLHSTTQMTCKYDLVQYCSITRKGYHSLFVTPNVKIQKVLGTLLQERFCYFTEELSNSVVRTLHAY